MYKAYIEAANQLNAVALQNPNDVERIAKSEKHWANNQLNGVFNRSIPVRKGDVYGFDFGKNYKPEMTYQHRGIVFGMNGNLLYVLPITSFKSSNPLHIDAFHPVDNPSSKSDLFLLKKSEGHAFITHDSLVKLNDIRTVSLNRKMPKKYGVLDTTSTTYQQLEDLVIQRYFPTFHYQQQLMLQQAEASQNELDKLRDQVSGLRAELELLKSENTRLSEIQGNQ